MNFKKKKLEKKKPISRKKSASRLLFISSCICVAFSFFTMRLVYIMIYKHEEYSEMAENQREAQYIVQADRGDILARNGAVLATTIGVYRVDLDLKAIREYAEEEKLTIESIGKSLANALEMDANEVIEKLETKDSKGNLASSAILVRGIEKNYADKVEALDIYGVIISSDTKRLYPANNYLSHALGSVNLDNQGLNGVELYYDKYLAGISGMKIVEVDASASQLPSSSKIVTPPIPGKDVTLTIDENIQHIVEDLAQKALVENSAKGVSIIVTNPNNGEILAMTNKPDYNPNNIFEEYEAFPGETDSEKLQNMFKNSLVSDSFEPGSTFKNFTMMAAMEEGVVSENDTFVCTGGKLFGDTMVKCWKEGGHGTQTLPEILQNSCNVGFMELAEKLGTENLYKYLNKYGFGDIEGIDLPGEEYGIMKSIKDITPMDLGIIVFGQTNTTTAIQLITTFNAIANGGDLIQPHIMKEISHIEEDGTKVIDETFKPEIEENIMSEENTAVLRGYLERTLNQGGEIGAFMGKEYRVGGKTGTAEKPDTINGGYAKDKFIASVLAMYPVNDPQITVYIKVDEPSPTKYYGGEVTNPITKELIKSIDAYIKSPIYTENSKKQKGVIVPDVRGKSTKEAAEILKENKLQVELENKDGIVVKMNPLPGTAVLENSKVNINSGHKDNIENKVIMPDLKGYTLEEIDEVLTNKIGITYSASGTGKVVKQSIEKGETITKGTKVSLELN